MLWRPARVVPAHLLAVLREQREELPDRDAPVVVRVQLEDHGPMVILVFF